MSTATDILELFAGRYPRSGMRRGGRPLRIRAVLALLPGAADRPDTRDAALAALEELEHSGILRIGWQRFRRGDEPLWVELADPLAMYQRLGRPGPDSQAMAATEQARQAAADCVGQGHAQAAAVLKLLAAWLDDPLTQPYPLPTVEDIRDSAAWLRLTDTMLAGTALRALSIRLFRDSKRLEQIAPLIRELLRRAIRDGSISRSWAEPRMPRRVWPMVQLAARARIDWQDGSAWQLDGSVIALSSTALSRVLRILPLPEQHSATGPAPLALSLENKESFHALASRLGPFNLVLLCGGRPNRAVRALLCLLGRSGWHLAHAGDLDPDGLAIAGNVAAAFAPGHFSTLGMNSSTFDLYQQFGRPLPRSVLGRLAMLDQDTLALPGLATTAARIAETGVGVEQEIIDYHDLMTSG
jgi:hypothetical protein